MEVGFGAQNLLSYGEDSSNLQGHRSSTGLIPSSKRQSNKKNAKERMGAQLQLSEMVQLLHLKKLYSGNIKELYPAITEEDLYSCHPADLLKNGRRYFISYLKYTNHLKPRRVRATRCGYRWKQQGRASVLNYNGQPVAVRTFLSFTALRSTNHIAGGSSNDPNYVSKAGKSGCIRRHAIYTMEETILMEDYVYEKNVCSKNITPRPIPVLCHILCKWKDPYYISAETIPPISSASAAASQVPCLEESDNELKLTATFNDLEPLDGTVIAELSELSYWESLLLP